MKILIVKLGAIGDVIRTTAILKGLKEKFENAEIYWITKKSSSPIIENNPEINKIFLIEHADECKNIDYDWVISLDDEDSACSIASSVSCKKITGAILKEGRKTYTDDSSLWFDMGLLSKFGKEKADILKAKNRKTYQEIIYKILNLEYKKQEPSIFLDDIHLKFGKRFAKKNNIRMEDKAIGVNTGAGGRWEDKKLSVEKTAEMIEAISKKFPEAKIILFGGPEEHERNKKILEISKAKIIDAGCDNSLMEFASLVDLCNVLITSDSLALHIGIALKKKIVSFFCPTSPWEIEIYGRGEKIIPKKGCICCYRRECSVKPDYDIKEIAEKTLELCRK